MHFENNPDSPVVTIAFKRDPFPLGCFFIPLLLEVVILKRAEKSMARPMCSVKLVDKKNTEELIDMLELKEPAHKLARVNGVRWYSHILRQHEKYVLIKAMVYNMDRKHKWG